MSKAYLKRSCGRLRREIKGLLISEKITSDECEWTRPDLVLSC